jgi:biotin-(acetyl-CoA carboxylase) ligase
MDVGTISNILLVIAIVFIAIGVTRAEQLSKPQKETIRYIPRTLEEEQKEPVKAEKLFKTMFEQQTPWIGSFNNSNIVDRRKLDKDRGLLKP